MINKSIMMDYVYRQLAIDYNCSPDDFLKDGLIFTEAKKNEGRRPFPFSTPSLQLIRMGSSVIICASDDILLHVREHFFGKTCDEAFWSPLIHHTNPYFLPDIDRIAPLDKPGGFEYEIVERDTMHRLYEADGFQHNALSYDINHLRPDMIATVVKHNNEIVGVAGASADCKTMWQIGVDVLSPYRGKGLAAILVNMLTLEILKKGYVPYYGTSDSNVMSMRVAVKAGYIPSWVLCYKTKLDGIIKTIS